MCAGGERGPGISCWGFICPRNGTAAAPWVGGCILGPLQHCQPLGPAVAAHQPSTPSFSARFVLPHRQPAQTVPVAKELSPTLSASPDLAAALAQPAGRNVALFPSHSAPTSPSPEKEAGTVPKQHSCSRELLRGSSAPSRRSVQLSVPGREGRCGSRALWGHMGLCQGCRVKSSGSGR